MTTPRAIWLDCCFVAQRHDLCRVAVDFCEPHRLFWPADVLAAVRVLRPDFVCVEYDYPNRARLAIIPLLRQHFPGLRVLMFTDYHTEPLAVWAFRNRVWEYRVKPVTAGVFARLVETLARRAAAQPRCRRAAGWPMRFRRISSPLRGSCAGRSGRCRARRRRWPTSASTMPKWCASAPSRSCAACRSPNSAVLSIPNTT